VALAKQENLILGVGHLMVYQPALLKLQSLISEGELGDILSVQCTRINLGKVRNEENVWWSLAPHDLSILAMLFSAIGESFDAINAIKMTPLARPGIEDAVFAQFETPSGKNASIHVSWLSPEKRHETVVIGSRKIAVFEDTQPADQKLSIMDYDLKRSEEGFGDITRGEFTPVSYETPKDDLLTLEAKAFLNAIASSQGSNAAISLQNDGENGLQVVQMLDKVQQMLNTRQPSLSVR